DDGHSYCFARHGVVNKSSRPLDKREQIEYPSPIYLGDILEDTSIVSSFISPNRHLKDVNKKDNKGTSLNNYTEEFLGWRGISEASMRAFGVKSRVNENGVPVSIAFP